MSNKSFLTALTVLALTACGDAPTSPSAVPATARLIVNQSPRPSVVISQVYGGGGNSGSTYRNDFIELHNIGSASVDLSTWSVQYTSAAGSSWAVTRLSGSIAAGGYYLVQQAQGAGGTVNLPTPDASNTTPMSATGGKVVLANQITAVSGTCPTTGVVDAVHFGTGSANPLANGCADAGNAWGSPTAATANATAAIRNGAGCAFTGNPSADFTIAAPTPRNSATAAVVCAGVTPVGPIASIALTPSSATVVVGGTQTIVATGADAAGATISGATFLWMSSNTTAATVSTTGVVTAVAPGSAQILAISTDDPAVVAIAQITVSAPATLPSVRFSELHYDNAGTDAGEAIEIEGPAGTDLTGWSIVLYNGNGGVPYDTRALSGLIANSCGGSGVVVAQYPINGIQNGGTAASPDVDGLALIDQTGTVVEFLSYEGTMTATSGPAAGMTSRSLGAVEDGSNAIGTTLQRSLADTWSAAPDNFGGCNGRTTGTGLISMTFSGRLLSDPALPVGFQDQIFATVRRGGTVTNEAVVWSSDTPALASIDSRGVITAVAAGTAVFRATTTDGQAFGTYSLPMIVAQPWANPTYAGNTEFGDPTDGTANDEFVIRRAEFTSSFNPTRNIPNWASYNLDASQRDTVDRCDCFTFDPELIAAGMTPYTTADYTGAGAWWNTKQGLPAGGAGIDRGHLVRSSDRTRGALDNARTFYFANIVPQFADNNQGPWSSFETALGDSAKTREVYIVTGASGSIGTLKDEGRITIPSAMWKVALIAPRDARLADITSLANVTVLAVIMPNVNGIRNVPWSTYVTTVDAVELLSGYDVLSLLRDDLELALESGTKPPTAVLDGPYVGAEGGAISMSGAASSDPDANQSLTYAWSFGDGGTATGALATHTYTDNGSYAVRLIVTDPLGLADTTTTTATVANVAPDVAAFAGASLVAGELYTSAGTFADPGADSFSATVDYGDGSGAVALPVNAKTFALQHRYDAAGTFTVTVAVRDDDGATGTRTASVTVLSEVQTLGAAVASLDQLVGQGRVTRGLANSLKVKLDNAAASFARGNGTAAINQAEAALNELDALVRSGGATESQVAATRRLIERAIASMAR